MTKSPVKQGFFMLSVIALLCFVTCLFIRYYTFNLPFFKRALF